MGRESAPGRASRRSLEPFRSLIEKGPQVEYGQILRDADLKGPVGNTRIWVDDVNSDGKLDILVGDMAYLISPADGLSEEEFKKKFADWKKSREEVSATTEFGGQRREEASGGAAANPGALRAA